MPRSAFQDLAHDVGRLVLRLVIRPGLHLREQADRHELQAAEDQQHAEQQQRAIADAVAQEQPHEPEIRA